MSSKFLPEFKYLNLLLKHLVLLMVLFSVYIALVFLNMSLSNSGNHSKAEGTHKILRNFRERGSDQFWITKHFFFIRACQRSKTRINLCPSHFLGFSLDVISCEKQYVNYQDWVQWCSQHSVLPSPHAIPKDELILEAESISALSLYLYSTAQELTKCSINAFWTKE